MTTTFERVGSQDCVECPGCGFTFAALHTDDDNGRRDLFTCPVCGYSDDTETVSVTPAEER